jgi:hypothetical protein
MKQIIAVLFALFTWQVVSAQARILTRPEVEQLFPESVQQQLELRFPIRVVYNYTDLTGTYYMPFCEKVDAVKEKDTSHSSIRAVNLKFEQGKFVKQWEMNDMMLKEQEEESIWFFTKYTTVKDLDGDGRMDPVVVYGSSGLNGVGDGRMKILIYYKGKKVAIRHQNSEMDEGRHTEVDKDFYGLPEKVQVFVRGVMRRIAEDDNSLFQHNWEQKMLQQKLLF